MRWLFLLVFLCTIGGARPAHAAEKALLVPQRLAPAVDDTDGDGLSDAMEVQFGFNPALVDMDADGLADGDELQIYHTDPKKGDSDKDGFFDGKEVLSGYSPIVTGKKLVELDTDSDGLIDSLEIAFNADLMNPDTDADGYSDGVEIYNAYDPRSPNPVQMVKSININTKTQKLLYYVADIAVGEFLVSTGKKSTPTPLGEFTITKKDPRAWSRMASLWMPWWMNFTGSGARPGAYALHELPEWPSGLKEGAAHLGKAVSHGCIRLGIGAAKFLYDWTPIGTKVTIVSK